MDLMTFLDPNAVPANLTANVVMELLKTACRKSAPWGKKIIDCIRKEQKPDSAQAHRLQLLADSLDVGTEDPKLAAEVENDLDLMLKRNLEFQEGLFELLRKLDMEHEIVITLRKRTNDLFADDRFTPIEQLFGRDDERAEMSAKLCAGQPHVIQLIGQSGVGKTALVAKVVQELNLDYVRVELQPDATALKVGERLYQIFCKQAAPPRPFSEIVAAMVEAWTQRKCLLIVDNLHRLLNDKTEPADEDARLLLERISQTECQLLTLGWPGTDALGTSRERVLRWELEGIKADPGVQKLRAEGVVGEPKTITLEQVVDNLDGNPKMLEILAELIRKHEGEAAILDRHPDWVGESMAPLQAMWEVIGPELQQLCAALCVLRRGRDAARLGRMLGRDRRAMQKQLESLLDWKLAKCAAGCEDYEPDHDLVRRMAAEQLGETAIIELHRCAAAVWGAEAAALAEDRMPTRIEEVQPFIEATFHLAEAGESKALVSLLNAGIGQEAFAQVLDRLGAWGDRLYLWERAVAVVSDLHNEGVLRHHLGIAYEQLGDWDRALVEYEASLKIKEKLGDLAGIAQSRHQIGIVYQDKGDWDRALAEYEASLEAEAMQGNKQGIAQTRGQIGNVRLLKGDSAGALAEYDAILKIFDELEAETEIATTRHQIGIVYQMKGDWDRALAEYEASLKIREKLGDQQGIAKSRHQIGNVYYLREDWDRALAEYEASLKIEEKLGDKQGLAETHGQIGVLFTQRKEFPAAFEHTLIALLLFAEIGDPRGKQMAGNLARVRALWGAEDFDKAWKEKTGQEVPEWLRKG